MLQRKFGNSGLLISILGFGAGEIGDLAVEDKNVNKILNFALDNGINLIDTARGYYASEDRIGKFISHRRNEFVLSTKVGYGIPGKEDWSYDCIISGVDEALSLLQTDFIDIVHLHSCSLEILRRGDAILALQNAVQSGKVKVAAYSGENDELKFAVESNVFQAIQTSFNICDQRKLENIFPTTIKKHIGVIAKRPIANAPWRFNEQPHGHYAEEYWLRWKKMHIDIGIGWNEAALRFAAFSEGVNSCIVGTTNIEHLKQNIEIVSKGKLPEDIYLALRNAFIQNDDGWTGQV
ncbi:MAG: aldo/keto reductase [Ignavibacteriales bacterium]|nr:aldo/keto reductase [Ignavibacteriales bacterium]